MRVLILGGDSFCGRSTSLHLSVLDHDVAIVNNFSHRCIDVDLEYNSLTPIRLIGERLWAWKEVSEEHRLSPLRCSRELPALTRSPVQMAATGHRTLCGTALYAILVYFSRRRRLSSTHAIHQI
jgi:hypothetical protein